jgi:YHS domain-containing protein
VWKLKAATQTLAAAIAIVGAGCSKQAQPTGETAQTDAGTSPPAAETTLAQDFTDDEGNGICPASGDTIADKDSKEHRDYEGKRYSFCCGACLGEFEANPAINADGRATESGNTKPRGNGGSEAL